MTETDQNKLIAVTIVITLLMVAFAIGYWYERDRNTNLQYDWDYLEEKYSDLYERYTKLRCKYENFCIKKWEAIYPGFGYWAVTSVWVGK